MQNCWKPIEVIVPARLTASQVLNHIQAQIRISATEAGEFVQQIQLGVGQPHGDGWWKWTASYLPGPHAAFPENQQP